YPTSDGTPIRDYVHITDLAEAHLRALEYLLRGGESEALNLGTGSGTTVRQVIAAVARRGHHVPFRDAPRRSGDPPALVADPARAFGVLDWRPKRSDIDAIVSSAWN